MTDPDIESEASTEEPKRKISVSQYTSINEKIDSINAVNLNCDIDDDRKSLISTNKNKEIQIYQENIYAKLHRRLSNKSFDEFRDTLDNHTGVISANVLIDLINSLGNPDRDKCIKHVLDILKKSNHEDVFDINGVDDQGNTPLHYAIQKGDEEIILQLLRFGAALGIKNNKSKMPIEDIGARVLEKHLDNCIELRNEKKDDDFTIMYDYCTLVTGRQKKNIFCNVKKVYETDVIFYMSTNPELRNILNHPVIVSLLLKKWYQCRWIFYINLLFYITFFLSLIIYIFVFFANFTDTYSDSEIILSQSSWLVLFISFIIITCRELFQITIVPEKYFQNFENYLEILLLISSGLILFLNAPSISARKQLSSLSILISSFELILMIGKHPKLSTNVVMLKTVSYNFFKFFLWYSLLLIAFAFSFYILFSSGNQLKHRNNTNDTEKETFDNPAKSIVKTVVMLTGEFEASDMNFKTFPIVGRLILMLFIFMIAIILLNLLNGLAVNDTQNIKNDAGIIGRVYLAKYIRCVELLLAENVFVRSIHKLLKKMGSCYCHLKQVEFAVFPHATGYELRVYPNIKPSLMGFSLDEEIIQSTLERVYQRNENKSSIEIEIKEKLDEILKAIKINK